MEPTLGNGIGMSPVFAKARYAWPILAPGEGGDSKRSHGGSARSGALG